MNTEKQIDIKVANSCNLHCPNCLIKETMQQPLDFQKIQEVLIREKPDKVHFGGGEPLLDETNLEILFGIIMHFHNIKFSVTTNLCYPMSYLRLDFLNSVDELWTSFDIGRFNTFGDILRWMDNVIILKRHYKRIGLITCISPEFLNKDQRKYKKFIDWMGFDQYKFVPMINQSGLDKEKVLRFIDDITMIRDPKNKTLDMIANNKFTSCYYHHLYRSDDWKVFNGLGEEIDCEFSNNEKCPHIAEDCLLCNNLPECGGRCPQIECVFFDELRNKLIKDIKKRKR